MSDKTYGYIKKRVLDTLDECSDYSSFVSVNDTEREVIISRLPDALNSSLVRMYESLCVGLKSASFSLFKPKIVSFAKRLDDAFSFKSGKGTFVIVFFCAGDGSIEILDKNGAAIFEAVCEGGGNFARRAYFCDLDEGTYTVKKNGFLTVRDFALYQKTADAEPDAYAPLGSASFSLPENFAHFEKILFRGANMDKSSIMTNGAYAYFGCRTLSGDDALQVTYRITPPFITSDPGDDFEFDLSPVAIEALICLCASELCKEGDNVRYSRLVYKYTDFSEALRGVTEKNRNSFFKPSEKKRW